MASLNKTFFSVEVSETSEGRAYFANQEWAHPESRTADILIAPWENFRQDMDIVFPQGTADFYRALTRAGIGSVALAARPENYEEIALHGRLNRWPKLVVAAVLLPALAGALGDMAYDAISQSSEADTIQIEVVVEGEMGNCISVKYEGPSDRLAATLLEEVARCLPAEDERSQ